MNKQIIDNIHSDLLELSDINVQKEYWFGKNDQHSSSYTELMCRLFDDNDFDHFVDVDAVEYGFSDKLVGQLKQLRNVLNSYQEKATDYEIIEDLEWQTVANKANLVLRSWENEEPSLHKAS